MKAKLIRNLDNIPIGIQILPTSQSELNLIKSLEKAEFLIPIGYQKKVPESNLKVKIEITIIRDQG